MCTSRRQIWIHTLKLWIHIPGDLWIHTYEFVCIRSLFGIKNMATDHWRRGRGGGWSDRDDCQRELAPGSNSQNLDTFCLAYLANFNVATTSLAFSTCIKLIYDFRRVTDYNLPLFNYRLSVCVSHVTNVNELKPYRGTNLWARPK